VSVPLRSSFATSRNLVITGILCLCAAMGPTVNADAQEETSIPPAAPEGERFVGENPAFVASCFSKLERHLTGRKIITQLVTESDQWGPVLRLDLELASIIPKHLVEPNRVGRVVCWRRSDGIFGILSAIEPPL
jgi:hypothetical protein